MERLRTTTLPSNDLVSPSTSTATAALRWSFARRADTSGLLQSYRHRLADAQALGMLGHGLNTKHQPRALLLAVDDRRRKLGLRRDKIDACHEIADASVTAYRHAV